MLRSFVTSWQAAMKTHETVAENRIRFAQRLNEMSEELVTLSKEVDKNRKQVRHCSEFLMETPLMTSLIDQGAREPIRTGPWGSRNYHGQVQNQSRHYC